MAESMNGNFGKLLDEQKKSNEQLSTISQTLINDGSAKEIIKQSLPEVLNERQLAGRRDKFFKKTGMTETDNQVEKLIGRINELVVVEKSTNQKTKKQVDELGDFLKETKSPLLQIYKNSRNRSLTKAVMDKNQKLFQKKFYGYEDTKAIRMKKEIELAEKEIKQRKIGLEKQGKNAEKDIDLQNDMLALERRKERLARRQSPGIIARTIGAGKNQIRILKELGLLRGTFRVLFSPFKALGKIGLKAFGGFGGLALAVALPALFLFLNSSFWQKTKEFLVNKLIPFVGDLYNDYILPFGKLIGGLLIDAWNLILKYAPKLVDFVKDLYNDYILPFGGIIADFLPKAWNFVIDALMGERRAVGPGGQFSERSGGIVGKVFGFGKAIFDLGAMAFNALMSAGTYLKEAFLGKFVTIGPRGFRSRTRQGGLVGFIGNIIDFFYNLPTTMRDTFDNAYEFVTSSIATGLGKIADFFAYIFTPSGAMADVYDATIGKIPGFSKNPFRTLANEELNRGARDPVTSSEADAIFFRNLMKNQLRSSNPLDMSTGFDYVARNINVDTIQPLNRGARDPITVNQIVKDVANFNGQVVSPSGGSSTVTSPHEFRNFAQDPN